MQHVAFEEIKNIAEYEIERETFRPLVLAVRRERGTLPRPTRS